MTLDWLLMIGFGLALAVAGGLSALVVSDAGLDLARRIYQRTGARRWRRVAAYLRSPLSAAEQMDSPTTTTGRQSLRQFTVLLPAGGGVALAVYLLPHSVLLAGYAAVIGGAMSFYLLRRRRVQRSTVVVADLAKLLTVFQSRYRLYQTVVPALEAGAERVGEPLRSWVNQAVQAVHAGRSVDAGLDRLDTASGEDPYLVQFTSIARRVHQADAETVDEVLWDLDARLRERDHLLAEQRITLATVSITARILQAAALVAVLIALLVLGDFYFISLSRQGIFIIVTMALLGTSYYFDQRILSLQERVL